MINILRKLKVRYVGKTEIAGLDKKCYHLVVASKEKETSRNLNGWALGKTDILFFGVLNQGRMVFLDSKDCLVKLG